jgi:hypothetical protein
MQVLQCSYSGKMDVNEFQIGDLRFHISDWRLFKIEDLSMIRENNFLLSLP